MILLIQLAAFAVIIAMVGGLYGKLDQIARQLAALRAHAQKQAALSGASEPPPQ